MTTQDQHELEITRIMHEATRDLHIPAGRLAAGGLRRGRVARVRRRAGIGLAAVAVAASVGVTYQVLPRGNAGADPQRGADSRAASGPVSASVQPRRALVDGDVALRRVLDALPPGRVTGASAEPLGHAGPGFAISLHLDGSLVSFYVDDPNHRRTQGGLSALGPGSECRGSDPVPDACHRLADGSWEENFSRPTGGAGVPADLVENDAWYWSADGWRIYSSAYNASAEKTGTKTADVPPLTIDQLRAIAQSDVWFSGATG